MIYVNRFSQASRKDAVDEIKVFTFCGMLLMSIVWFWIKKKTLSKRLFHTTSWIICCWKESTVFFFFCIWYVMWFQGCKYREKLPAIAFPVCCYSRKEPLLMGKLLFPSNSALSSQVTPFNLSWFGIHMYILINLGETLSCMCFVLHIFFKKYWCLWVFQGKYFFGDAHVQNVHSVSQFHGGRQCFISCKSLV